MLFKVAHGLCVLAFSIALLLYPSMSADAGTDAGQFCWTLTGFDDVIRCSITIANGAETMAELHCSDRSALTGYQVLGAGLARLSFPTEGQVQLNFVTASDHATAFGTNKVCSWAAGLSTATLNGSLTLECPGGSTTPKFTASAPMIFASCPTGRSAASATGGHGIGE